MDMNFRIAGNGLNQTRNSGNTSTANVLVLTQSPLGGHLHLERAKFCLEDRNLPNFTPSRIQVERSSTNIT